jgi:hypothetical protein
MEEQPLGENVDKDPAWPATAVYTQAEKASRSKGWPEMMGHVPTPEDLVVPMPQPTNRGPRVGFGGMRTDHHSYKRLVKDMEALGLRHRRGHDLRRTLVPSTSPPHFRGWPSAPRWPGARCSVTNATRSPGGR